MSDKDNIKNNKNSIQIYYLCNDTENKCKKLIEMANVIVLNKLLKNQEYINESNDIAEEVINRKIDELTNKLIVPPMTKSEYEKYQDENIKKIEKDENEFINNMYMNMGMGMDQSSDMEYGIENMAMSGIEHMPTHMPTHIPRVGGNILKRKSYKNKKHPQQSKQPHQKNKYHKKSKRIRKI